MNIDILTLFPEMFESVFSKSIINRAQKNGLLEIKIHQLRDWATDKHKTTAPAMRAVRRGGQADDTPYGGGVGMVMKVDVIDRAIASFKLKTKNEKLKTKVILLTPQGKTFTQKKAKSLSRLSNLILVCGHYEGFDERVRYLVDEQISIGNYVLTGGEIPAMVLVDAIARLIPGVLGKTQSHQIESFSMEKFVKLKSNDFKPASLASIRRSGPAGVLKIKNLNLPAYGWLEFPQYTRPFSYKPISKKYKKSINVPKILLSGNHEKILEWRINKSYQKSHQNL